jgi:hypothetical protein
LWTALSLSISLRTLAATAGLSFAQHTSRPLWASEDYPGVFGSLG